MQYPCVNITEALSVASSMMASYCILTHFSQRYPRAPQVSSTLSLSPAIIAFDFLQLSVPSQLPHLAYATSKLVQIFSLCEQAIVPNTDISGEKKHKKEKSRENKAIKGRWIGYENLHYRILMYVKYEYVTLNSIFDGFSIRFWSSTTCMYSTVPYM